ncbi:MAG: hypothetical protein GX895_02850 [Clostridiales bacterium]|uniref:CLC_0170 family protein n=1 Tax=Clostridium sp. N3C TaxID=1776758 RepID=UPI00092DED51|nr:hypothetical protein [Clostridiales bacterium]SCN23848.1 hypothetical protein N3C_1525 [Clostridium sp. N3C]
MILRLFNEYFLALVIILSLQVIFYDSKEFMKKNRVKKAKKARFIGGLYIGLALLLYLCNKLR